ncbi:NADPH-dependent assimilatory sulfite reductase hemoprotein subunit [Planctomycetaceae bacterium]|nr:NADPH-dependent assimilatory sulfite reductase hemoprotein subunit [Planctomycetaceae bacterium]MDC0274437.1 NADPH-dependent assimilatory sulfite reductase hemoprotein subunit [Planctomycetaceae bacterium]
MSDQNGLSKLEILKENSRQFRGTIAEELVNGEDNFSGDAVQLLKHHGMYQQDDRDLRKAKNPDGTPKGKTFICMVRTRIPGGKVNAKDFLTHLDLCEKYGDGTLRVTTRQGFQLHHVVKDNLKETMRGINETLLTTLAACGDVERNVMCCPAPHKNNKIWDQMQEDTDKVAEHLKPQTTAYADIWLRDADDTESGSGEKIAEFKPVEEPIYGERYLPRKFKTAFALPEDNCIDIYTQDLGFLGIVENDELIGYNVIVGGGMGTTPSVKDTFPATGQKMTYVSRDQVCAIAEAIVKVQRDFGNRENRKRARMKYLIFDWGLEKFKTKVEEYFGASLPEPHAADVTGVEDHMGWYEQGDGKLFLGINVQCGRIKDDGDARYKTGIRTLIEKYGMETRLTARQGVILCDIDPSEKESINTILREHGMIPAEELTLLNRYSMACPAFPTCGLSITESERAIEGILEELEGEMRTLGIIEEKIALHMTGCPNGCARPYVPDIGLVGKAKDKYTVFLGGNAEGTRVNYIYKDLVPRAEILSTLRPAFTHFKDEREVGESFGNFCHRIGQEEMQAHAESFGS